MRTSRCITCAGSRIRSLLGGRDGIALLIVLVVITILTTLVVSFTDTTQKHLLVTQYYKNRLQAYWAAQSGLQAAVALLKNDPQAGEQYTGATSLWNCESTAYQEFVIPILASVFCESCMIEGALLQADTGSGEDQITTGRCPAAVLIEDEDRKLSLARLVTNPGQTGEKTDDATFLRVAYLLETLLREEDLAPQEEGQDTGLTLDLGQAPKITHEKATELAGYLVDWMDTPNNNPSDPTLNPDTAEESCPADGLPYEAKNGMLDSIDEIGLVCGFRQMTRTTIEKLTRNLTAYDLVTNINTATIPVLNALCSQLEGTGTLNETYGVEIYQQLHPAADQESIEIIQSTSGNNNSYDSILVGINPDVVSGLKSSTGFHSEYFRIGVYGLLFDTETGTVMARARLLVDLRRPAGQQLALLYYRED
jgi:type II secretory pathway component PulK